MFVCNATTQPIHITRHNGTNRSVQVLGGCAAQLPVKTNMISLTIRVKDAEGIAVMKRFLVSTKRQVVD